MLKNHVKNVEEKVQEINARGINWLNIYSKLEDKGDSFFVFSTKIEDMSGKIWATIVSVQFESTSKSRAIWELEEAIESTELQSYWSIY